MRGFIPEVVKPSSTKHPPRKEVLHHGAGGKQGKLRDEEDERRKRSESDESVAGKRTVDEGMGDIHDECDLPEETEPIDHVMGKAMRRMLDGYDECDLDTKTGPSDHILGTEECDKCDPTRGTGPSAHIPTPPTILPELPIFEATRNAPPNTEGRNYMRSAPLTSSARMGSCSNLSPQIRNDVCSNISLIVRK